MTTLPKCWSDNSDESDVDSDDIFDESSMIMARTSVGRRGKGGCDLSDHATARGCGKDEPTRDVPNSRRGSTYKTKKYRTKSYMTLKEDNDQFGMHEIILTSIFILIVFHDYLQAAYNGALCAGDDTKVGVFGWGSMSDPQYTMIGTPSTTRGTSAPSSGSKDVQNYLDSVHGELKEEMKVELKEEMKNELKEEMRA
ncbi:hypothetical protein Tco_1554068 [Tanacetum coccineum]